MDRIDDIVSNPIEEANEEERQEKITQLRNKLKKETKDNGDNQQTAGIQHDENE